MTVIWFFQCTEKKKWCSCEATGVPKGGFAGINDAREREHNSVLSKTAR